MAFRADTLCGSWSIFSASYSFPLCLYSMKTSCYLVYMLCVALVTSLTSSCKHEAIKEGQCAFPASSLVWAMRPRQRTVLPREVVIPQETSAQWSPREEGRRSEREMRESCFESLSQHLGSFHQQLWKTLSVWGAGIKAVPSQRWYLMKIWSYFNIPGLDICFFIGVYQS